MEQEVTGQPGRIVVAGDWHRNIRWGVSKIRAGTPLLDGETDRIFVHLGDFGFWPDTWGRWHHDAFLLAVSAELRAADARMLVVDGNHENHDMLDGIATADAARAGVPPPHKVMPRIWWLPRGFRWQWGNRTWVAIGGGVSVNRAKLTEGWDWFPQEQISDEQEAAILAAGPADVIVSHDCPSGVAHTYPPPQPGWDLADLARSDVHQERLQRMGMHLRPQEWMHGHLHQAYTRTVDIGWGPVKVTGLDCDYNPKFDFLRDKNKLNTAIVDVANLTWTPYD